MMGNVILISTPLNNEHGDYVIQRRSFNREMLSPDAADIKYIHTTTILSII